MADLDDFFAKKDRKKSKSTKKFATTEEVAKKLEKNEKIKKERPGNDGEDNVTSEQDQDEWKDFEEEKKDYTGLKIGNLTSNPNPENPNAPTGNKESSEEQREEEPGHNMEKKSAGPWKRMQDVKEEKLEEKEDVKEKEREKEREKDLSVNVCVKTGRYVPPSMRSGSGQVPVQTGRSSNRSKAAPDIHNEEYFPTLSKSEPRKGRSEGSFELVQSNRSSYHRQQGEQSKIGQSNQGQLSLGNRFNTLSNDS
ncbi:unnamed protein product [Phyllotreta striolata]|uniref:CDV3-like protein n=1 Tax=Phyllotreta striolata TaxID=444603 RepID=A0A9N9TT38_PHYSR|nr:unnamed protein product [Phyllotreta striolata]